jgi:K+-sensing histidine kinase KdpD
MTSSTTRSDDGTFASVAIAFVVGVTVVAVETAACAFLLDHRLTDVVMVYLLGVVLVAMRFGYAPSLFTAAASVAAFDFFFTLPYFSFAVADKRYVVTSRSCSSSRSSSAIGRSGSDASRPRRRTAR